MDTPLPADLLQAAARCLAAADPADKVALTQRYAAAFRRGELAMPDYQALQEAEDEGLDVAHGRRA